MSVWQNSKLKDLITCKTGKLDSNAMEEGGNYPFFTCDPKTLSINSYAFDTTAILLAGNNAKGIFPIKFYSGKFNCYQRTYVIENIDNSISDLKFLFFAIKVQLELLRNMSSGSTTKFLTKDMIENLTINLPPLSIQQQIAKKLSVYDNLIENNLKRINLLEESARTTYEEWFLFRKIHGQLIPNSEITVTPLVGIIDDFMNGGWGKEKSTGSYSQEAHVIRGTDIPKISQGNFSNTPLRFHKASNLEPRKLNIGDIIVEMSNGNIGNVGRSIYFDFGINSIFSKGCMCASFCKMIKPKSLVFSYFIDLHLKYIQSTNKMFIYKSQGANGINNFRFEDMINEEVINIPNGRWRRNLIVNFRKIYSEKSNLRIQIKLLREAKDILLPRFITGKIDTEKMDKVV